MPSDKNTASPETTAPAANTATPSPSNDLASSAYSSNPTNITSILNPSKSSADLSNMNNNTTITTTAPLNKLKVDTPQSNDDNDSSRGAGDFDSNDNDSLIENNNDPSSSKLPPRKRSKVSRACDECRRKKIRCNAVFDINQNTIITICTSCERNGYSCTFTRIPLKRGPNKGYTKKSSSSTSLNSNSAMENNKKTSPRTPQSPSFNNNNNNNNNNNIVTMSPQNDASSTFTYSENNSRSNSNNKPPLHFLSNQQQQVILPPLNSIPFKDKSDTSANANQQQNNNQANQAVFWKVPTDMPNLPPNVNLNGRKGSIDSTHSSISSVSSNALMFNTGMKRNIKSNSSYMSNGVENSDSEDEFLANNTNRLSSSTFQVPFALNSRSARLSFTSDKDPRSSISSSIISSSSAIPVMQNPQLMQQFNQHNQPNQLNQTNNPNFRMPEYKESLNFLLDHYYSTLYPQYPLLPNPEIIKMSIAAIIDNSDFFSIVELFYVALQSISVITDLTIQKQSNPPSSPSNNQQQSQSESIISIKFGDVTKCFEVFTSMYLSKSLIYQSVPGKIVLTSTLLLLNYAIVISGYNYSLGFGIAFSYFKDWLIFKEGYESPCFANLIQLVSLDSLHTLYYGLPRSSTICFAIDSIFIATFLKEVKFPQGVEFEWLSVGLHLVVLNNSLQELDNLNKLDSIEITGTEYKFMSIIKLYYDVFIYCRNLNLKLQQIVGNYNSNVDKVSLNEILKNFIYNVELDISKISKKLTNLIDEQIDDIELTKPNPLIALVLIKCTHISINTQIFIKSIIHLNEVLDVNNTANKSTSLNNSSSGNVNRSRSDSDASLDSFNSNSSSDFSTVLAECNKRFAKLNENIGNNINRCQNIKHTHQHSHDLISVLINSKKTEILVPRTSLNSNKNGIDFSVVIQNWVRLINVFFSGEITKEGINGWSCV